MHRVYLSIGGILLLANVVGVYKLVRVSIRVDTYANELVLINNDLKKTNKLLNDMLNN